MNVSALVEKDALYLQGIYFVCKFLTKALVFLLPIAGVDPIPYQSLHTGVLHVPGEDPVSLCFPT